MIKLINNEALGVIAICSTLDILPQLNVANAYLVLPLLFDKKIRAYLKRKNVTILSAQELIVSKSDYFVGFNDKFTDSLVMTTNSILVGVELGVLEKKDNILLKTSSISLDQNNMCHVVSDIKLASQNMAKILSETPDVLYPLLRLKI